MTLSVLDCYTQSDTLITADRELDAVAPSGDPAPSVAVEYKTMSARPMPDGIAPDLELARVLLQPADHRTDIEIEIVHRVTRSPHFCHTSAGIGAFGKFASKVRLAGATRNSWTGLPNSFVFE
jgi:hypothetical protein